MLSRVRNVCILLMSYIRRSLYHCDPVCRCQGSRQSLATLCTHGLDLSINGISATKKVGSSKSLGVEIDEFLTWDAHITIVSKKVSSGKPFVPTSNLISVYQSIIEPYFDYCSIVWDDINEGLNGGVAFDG